MSAEVGMDRGDSFRAREDRAINAASGESVAAARAYEQFFVPALFAEWTAWVADAARIGTSDRVLDVACGTGVLAREIRSRTGGNGGVTGLDANAGMLAVAAERAPDIEWRHGTAESLPFPDRSFDAVVSQFGLMFFSDRQRAVREMARVLAPGGRLAVAVWDSLDDTPAYAAEVALLERMAGRAAADALRAPFVLGSTRALVELFETAGLGGVIVQTRRGTARFPSLGTMVGADLRGWLPVMGVVLPEDLISRILKEAEIVLAPYVQRDGAVVFDSPGHIVTATR